MDLALIADKLLDSFNRHRQTGEESYLQNARRYAAILKLEPDAFPKLLKRLLPRGSALKAPSD